MARPQRKNAGIRYSEAFKMQVVREVEGEGLACDHVRRKYGIRGAATVPSWVRKYGNGSWGKRIRVETPEEINRTEQLKRRVRLLEQALADANIDLALERQYTRLACERAGIQDVAAFKKKQMGRGPRSRRAGRTTSRGQCQRALPQAGDDAAELLRAAPAAAAPDRG